MAGLGVLTANWPQAIGLFVLLGLLYCVGLAIQRLYLSPIAHIPGPKLGALTFWYEFYYDVIKQGRYTWKIKELHEQYGPIIRINPYEVHINDPDFYNEIYTGPSKRRDKWSWSAGMFGNSSSFFGALSHDLHRRRRAPLNPFFSKASITKLQPMINKNVEILSSRLENFRETGEVVRMRYAFGAISMDVVTEYAFGTSYKCLEEEDFAPIWPDSVDSLSEQSHLNKQMPWVLTLMRLTPLWIVERVNPHIMRLIRFQMDMATQVTAQMKQEDSESTTSPSDEKTPTIFSALLAPDALPPSERTVAHLVDEAQSIVAAGQVTTTHYLNAVAYHIIANPRIVSTLKHELASAMPDSSIPPLSQLEKLPYLTAVVLEGYRISYGPTHRLQRISPDEPLFYKTTMIPAGTPMSMTSLLIHDNEALFPSPHEFKPERWLESGAREKLSNYLVNFSKGTRGCLGKELASAEIYLVLAVLFRRFEFELYKTEREDIDVAHDFFNPQARKGSKGLRVVVK